MKCAESSRGQGERMKCAELSRKRGEMCRKGAVPLERVNVLNVAQHHDRAVALHLNLRHNQHTAQRLPLIPVGTTA